MYNNCIIHTDMYVHVYIIYILIYLSTYTCAYNIHVCGHLYIYIYMFVFARLDAGCFCCLGNHVCRFAAPSRINCFLIFDLFAKVHSTYMVCHFPVIVVCHVHVPYPFTPSVVAAGLRVTSFRISVLRVLRLIATLQSTFATLLREGILSLDSFSQHAPCDITGSRSLLLLSPVSHLARVRACGLANNVQEGSFQEACHPKGLCGDRVWVIEVSCRNHARRPRRCVRRVDEIVAVAMLGCNGNLLQVRATWAHAIVGGLKD